MFNVQGDQVSGPESSQREESRNEAREKLQVAEQRYIGTL